ncbi:MAG: hypothetical protein N2745_05515 [Syntrophorhabdaceae bacterium]|nr:hypothetical protein [Syntrophorhabdaceae bacterium]
MNRIFLSGRVRAKPEVMYTLKGERVIQFPLKVEEGGLDIKVVYVDREGLKDIEEMAGKQAMVVGSLLKISSEANKGQVKVKANQIIWMEE